MTDTTRGIKSRPLRILILIVFTLIYWLNPLTMEFVVKRPYRWFTVPDPKCRICYRPSAGTVSYGENGKYSVAYCSIHLISPSDMVRTDGHQITPGWFHLPFLALLLGYPILMVYISWKMKGSVEAKIT